MYVQVFMRKSISISLVFFVIQITSPTLKTRTSMLNLMVFFSTDNHDIISIKVYELEVDHSNDDQSKDYTKILPEADFFASPRGLCIV